MNTINYSKRSNVAPSHSFHPNASLLLRRRGYVAGVDKQ